MRSLNISAPVGWLMCIRQDAAKQTATSLSKYSGKNTARMRLWFGDSTLKPAPRRICIIPM